MAALSELKEIVELEILVTPSLWDAPCDIEQVKPLAIDLLQASECHKDCTCDYGCGCAETSECSTCNPPKRFLRLKTCPRSFREQGFIGLSIDAGICYEEMEVFPRQVRPKESP